MIDTSSVIELRNVPRDARDTVITALNDMVERDILYFPPQVLAELSRIGPDVAQTWAKRNAQRATRYGYLYDEARQVLQRIPNLIDPARSGEDQADPYVIATGQELANTGCRPTVITDDVSNKPGRTSLAAGAGVFGFPSMPLAVFLATQGIYSA